MRRKAAATLRNANRKERNIDFKGIVNPPYGCSSTDSIIDSWSLPRVEQEPTQVSDVTAAVWLQAGIGKEKGGKNGRIERPCSNSLTSHMKGWNEGRSRLHRRLEEACTSSLRAVISLYYFNCRVRLVTNLLLSWNLSPEWFVERRLSLSPGVTIPA